MADRLLEEKWVGLKFVFRVEDKMGLLKERDQTIVTMETEISEVLYHKNKTGGPEKYNSMFSTQRTLVRIGFRCKFVIGLSDPIQAGDLKVEFAAK